MGGPTILSSVDTLHIYIYSINYLSNKVISPKYVLGSLVRSRLFNFCDGTIVITIETNEIHNARDYAKFINDFLIQTTSFENSRNLMK